MVNKKHSKSSYDMNIGRKYLRAIAHLNIGMQVIFPLALSFTPVMAARAETHEKKFLTTATQVKTIPYVLQPGDTLTQVAEKHHLTVTQLKKLNQYRTFARGFESLTVGDEIDVPLQAKNSAVDDTHDESAALAQRIQQAGNFLQNNPNSDSAKDLARSQALGAANSKANQEVANWLNGKGKVRVKLDADRDFSLKNSELDVLYPLWENKAHQVFAQGSVHHTDSRNQSNLGLGYRYFEGTYLLGANTFFDHDWSRSHSRLGIGAEYQRDFLKVAANAYMRLTNWKNSPDFDNYEERPANGWDIRTEGYLPAYPGIGGKLVYEQYYGDRVGLFGKDNQQKDPVAVTAGVNYSPFPLMKFNVDHRMGKGNQNDTRFGIDLNYVFGAPLSQQLDSSMLAASRSLAANRYDFVDRNNNIVLEYRKKDTISLSLVPQISGYSGESKSLGVSVNSSNGLEHINWTAPELLNHGGQIIQDSPGQYSVIVPEFQYGEGAINRYTIQAVAYDKSGNASQQATTTVIVTSAAVSVVNSTFTPTEIALPNDGVSTATLTLLLEDNKGQPVLGVDQDIILNITQSSRTQSDIKVSKFSPDPAQLGAYNAVLTAGTKLGVFTITPEIQNVKIKPAIAIIGDTAALADGSVKVVRNDAVADGIATNEIQAIVTNALNQPLPGVIVSFSTNNEANVVTANAETDSNGVATTTITSKKSGSTVVTASVNGTSQAVETNFIADAGSAEIAQGAFTVTVDNAVADGKATDAVQVIVTDATGNVVPDAAVKFSSPDAINVATPTTTTDAQGVATTTLTSTKAGNFTVNAEVNGKQSAVEVSFVAGPLDESKSSLTVKYNDTSINSLITKPANSNTTLTLTLKDAEGNPITEAEVQFKSSRKYTTISNVKNVGNGVYSATLTAERTGLLTPKGTVETLITTQIDGEESGLTATVDIVRGQYNVSTPPNVAYTYTASQVAALLEEYETIFFYTADWSPPTFLAIESITLPASAITGSEIIIYSDNKSSVTKVIYNNTVVQVNYHETKFFIYNGSQWVMTSG